MTTDKIKMIIGEHIFNFWQNCHDINRLNAARKELFFELHNLPMTYDIQDKYVAEYELLCKRCGIYEPLDFGKINKNRM